MRSCAASLELAGACRALGEVQHRLKSGPCWSFHPKALSKPGPEIPNTLWEYQLRFGSHVLGGLCGAVHSANLAAMAVRLHVLVMLAWQAVDANREQWMQVDVTGQMIAGKAYDGDIGFVDDAGQIWAQEVPASTRMWYSSTIFKDGRKQALIEILGNLCEASGDLGSIPLNADGQRRIACAGRQVWYADNAGVENGTWVKYDSVFIQAWCVSTAENSMEALAGMEIRLSTHGLLSIAVGKPHGFQSASVFVEGQQLSADVHVGNMRIRSMLGAIPNNVSEKSTWNFTSSAREAEQMTTIIFEGNSWLGSSSNLPSTTAWGEDTSAIALSARWAKWPAGAMPDVDVLSMLPLTTTTTTTTTRTSCCFLPWQHLNDNTYYVLANLRLLAVSTLSAQVEHPPRPRRPHRRAQRLQQGLGGCQCWPSRPKRESCAWIRVP